jgi:hypothetical protein
MGDERVQVSISGDSSQMEDVLEEVRVKAAFPQAVATVQSFLTPRRRQDGVSIDSEVDAIALDGAATVALADILVRYSNEVSRLVMAVDAAKTEAADKADTAFQLRQEIGRLRERLAKAEAPPY